MTLDVKSLLVEGHDRRESRTAHQRGRRRSFGSRSSPPDSPGQDRYVLRYFALHRSPGPPSELLGDKPRQPTGHIATRRRPAQVAPNRAFGTGDDTYAAPADERAYRRFA